MPFDDAAHRALEEDVKTFLEGEGFLVPPPIQYHEAWKENCPVAINLLRNRFTRTALYVRTRADRLAFHKDLPLDFEFEPKTTGGKNIDCEALPLCYHLALAQIGVRSLYPIRHTKRNLDVGFWVGEGIVPDVIMVPDRWTPEDQAEYIATFQAWFPATDVISTRRTSGSGDPFALFDLDKAEKWPDWRTLMRDAKQHVLRDAAERNSLKR